MLLDNLYQKDQFN